MSDAERNSQARIPRRVFTAMRVIEFVAVILGILAVVSEVYDRRQERAVRKAEMLSELVQLKLEHGEPASAGVRSILEVLASQGVSLRGFDFSGLDLRGARLSGAVLSGSNMSNLLAGSANLSGADLESVTFASSYMSDVDLSNALLGSANLSSAKFRRGTLAGADLSAALLTEAVFDGTDFSRATLSGANVSGAFLHAKELTLTQEQLDQTCWDGKRPPRLPDQLTAPKEICPYI